MKTWLKICLKLSHSPSFSVFVCFQFSFVGVRAEERRRGVPPGSLWSHVHWSDGLSSETTSSNTRLLLHLFSHFPSKRMYMGKYVKFNNVDQHLILVLQFLSNYLWIMKKTLNTNPLHTYYKKITVLLPQRYLNEWTWHVEGIAFLDAIASAELQMSVIDCFIDSVFTCKMSIILLFESIVSLSA